MNPDTQLDFRKKAESYKRQLNDVSTRKDALIKELFKMSQEVNSLKNQLDAANKTIEAQQKQLLELLETKEKKKKEKELSHE